uniref:Thyroglobulin n=1 Tax=Athene cunicularia TaxID=194338 RepID=A0A663N881_ATHCN
MGGLRPNLHSQVQILLQEQSLRYQHTYVPSCDAEGGYTPVQCQQGGQCWCVDTKGQEEVPGSRVQGERPRCPTDSSGLALLMSMSLAYVSS